MSVSPFRSCWSSLITTVLKRLILLLHVYCYLSRIKVPDKILSMQQTASRCRTRLLKLATMYLLNPKNRSESHLPSKKFLNELAKRGIDPAIFFGQDEDQPMPIRFFRVPSGIINIHQNIFSLQRKRPGAVTVTVTSSAGLLRFNNLCPRPDTCRSEALFLAEIILENEHSEVWLISLN